MLASSLNAIICSVTGETVTTEDYSRPEMAMVTISLEMVTIATARPVTMLPSLLTKVNISTCIDLAPHLTTSVP